MLGTDLLHFPAPTMEGIDIGLPSSLLDFHNGDGLTRRRAVPNYHNGLATSRPFNNGKLDVGSDFGGGRDPESLEDWLPDLPPTWISSLSKVGNLDRLFYDTS